MQKLNIVRKKITKGNASYFRKVLAVLHQGQAAQKQGLVNFHLSIKIRQELIPEGSSIVLEILGCDQDCAGQTQLFLKCI